MAKVYFVREEISIEIPVGTSVLEAEIQAGLAPDVQIPGKKNRGKILSEGFSRKVNFQPELQVKTVWLEKPETGEKSQSGK